MKSLTYFVPGRPLAFARAGSNNGRRYTPEPQKSYMKQVGLLCFQAMWDGKIGQFKGPVRMIVDAVFLPPKKKLDGCYKHTKSDLDNITKLQSDSVNGIAFNDDAIICEIVASKKWGKLEGVTVIFEDIGD